MLAITGLVVDFTDVFTVTFTAPPNRWTKSGTISILLDGNISVTLRDFFIPIRWNKLRHICHLLGWNGSEVLRDVSIALDGQNK
jgi:hypothetical protein